MKKLMMSATLLAAALTISTPASAQFLLEDLLFPPRRPLPAPRAEPREPSRSTAFPVSFSQRYEAGEIIVSFGDRRLYYITERGYAMSYPIAIPREIDRWQGVSVISAKKMYPDWRPTKDMIEERPDLPEFVPGGHPQNPLGVAALYLGQTLYRIHGTDNPGSIGTSASKGCIRMFNQDVLDLYERVKIGALVRVTYERFRS
jgi:lipoprotein-anchoring transpeptidase ErfK/SrfK